MVNCRRRRHPDFPGPVAGTDMRPQFERHQVVARLLAHDKIEVPPGPTVASSVSRLTVPHAGLAGGLRGAGSAGSVAVEHHGVAYTGPGEACVCKWQDCGGVVPVRWCAVPGWSGSGALVCASGVRGATGRTLVRCRTHVTVPMRMRTKLLLAGLGVVTAGAAFGGIVMAADPTNTVRAPYAQDATSVGPSGSIVQKTSTIASVSKPETGVYCVVLVSGIDAGRAVPAATPSASADWDSEVRVSRNHNTCPGNSIRVTTGTNGAAADQAFYLVIP
ncbi:hypothetical protein [Streptomyces sp. NPDC058279]|uniref:hypothetical protein n=1 Tax=Streptomyces sp. NPDC058279 TaxID=3346418 RepID=UPI0036E7870E